PEIVIGPARTTTSPRATPATVALPLNTTISSTDWPRGTTTSPRRTTWSVGVTVSLDWASAAAGITTSPSTATTRKAPRCMVTHRTRAPVRGRYACRCHPLGWVCRVPSALLPRHARLVPGVVRGAHGRADQGLGRDRGGAPHAAARADGFGQ